MACSCNNGTGFVVTSSSGDKIEVRTEVEAKSLAQRTGGSYRSK
jgi:hypothetical protein